MRGNFGFKSQQDPVAISAMVLLVFAVCLGGASSRHELRLALVELAALPLLIMSLPRVLTGPYWVEHRRALLLLGAVALLPLIQLIPLPPNVWTALPNRQELALALDLAGLPSGWIPLSLVPDKTWRSFLALLPPAAMFVAVLTMRAPSRLRLVQVLLGLTTVAVMLGMAQVVSGGERLYPWRTTDAGAVVGFFANRNHLATLCLIALPFVAVLGARAIRRPSNSSALHLWLAALAMGVLIVMIGVIRSRTGIALAAPVLIASFLAAWIGTGRGRPHIFLLGATAVSGIAIAAVGFLALAPIIDRFDRLGSPEGRLENWPIVAQAADAYLPLGSGIGSFDAVFRSVEPLNTLDPTFFNQAHNDYLETWLETGLLGAGLIVLFMIWFAGRALAAWKSEASTVEDLRRAATIGIAVVLAHSIVDYPLRTAAVATIFAMLCALLEVGREMTAPASRRRGPENV